MYIHNFYSDLLLAVKVLFDNHIFQNRNYVQKYEFNMGNRALQLPHDYKPNYEFPNIVVSLNDETPSYGQRPSVTQKIPGFNTDQIPVLYNQTNETVLLVQEEMVNTPISCIINCESQLQAKEIAALIRRWLPNNKFISFLTFVSYLEVSSDFLGRNKFDPAFHSIVNLYTKLNKRTGDIDYCYSLQYDPFIRLESITTAIPDSAQRVFQVSVDLVFMLPLPLFMFSDKLQSAAERIDIQINPSAQFEPINDFPISKLINSESSLIDLKKGYIRRNLLVIENNSEQIIVSLERVLLTPDQITNISTGSYKISVTRGADDYLYFSIGASETKYRTNISTIPKFTLQYDECSGLVIEPLPTGVLIETSNDEYLNIIRNQADVIITNLQKSKRGLKIKFEPSDLQLTSAYSYNLIKGENTLRNYQDYLLNVAENSVIFGFTDSQFLQYLPSLTSPLIIQFYLADDEYPFSVGGNPPKIGLVKIFNITKTTAEISWVSTIQTTSQIEYSDESTEYNQKSILNPRYTFNHNIVLRGLHSQLNYYFRINVMTIDNENYISNDYTFMTS